MSLIWTRHDLHYHGAGLWPLWDALNRAYYGGHPMLDSRFVAKLIDYFPSPHGIEVLSGHADGDCTALMLVMSPSPVITRAYKPSQAQLSLTLLPPGAVLSPPSLLRTFPAFVARLDFYSLDSKYHTGLIRADGPERQLSAVNIAIDVHGTFDAYWCARPKNLRKNISRYRNRLDRECGSCTLRITTAAADMRAAVARYGFIESRGWKGRSGTAIHPGNRQGNFYRDVMTDLAASGQAIVFELVLDSEVVASRLCIYNDDLLIILKTTFDEDYRKYAVGRILLHDTIQYVFEHKLSSTIDFYTGATKEQRDWATQCREMYHLSVYRPALAAPARKVAGVRQRLREFAARRA